MNIIRRENNRLFEEIEAGRIFEYDNSIFMKFIDATFNGHVYNAICLDDNVITSFTGSEEIQPVDADLIIH